MPYPGTVLCKQIGNLAVFIAIGLYGAHMRKAIWLLGILALATGILGCSGSNNRDKGPALKFMQGVQDGDKNKMYEAVNLTPKIVDDSREKLIHPLQYKQTDEQRKDSEQALRISGEIDIFSTKFKKLLPKSASFQITATKAGSSTGDTENATHFVRITYGNKAEAMADKTGRPIKEMVLHLQQATRTIDDRSIREFSFNSEDFDKIADRDFEVLSYF
jgi:hypothetical protein